MREARRQIYLPPSSNTSFKNPILLEDQLYHFPFRASEKEFGNSGYHLHLSKTRITFTIKTYSLDDVSFYI